MMMVAFILVCIVLHMKIRSLVLARDDVSRALCCFSRLILSETEEHKNKRTHRKAERLFKQV